MSRKLTTTWLFVLCVAFNPAALPVAGQEKTAPQKKRPASSQEDMRYYKKWLAEDVLYIITPEEKSVFSKLSTPEEREKFIDDFWRRRDPSPETMQNEFKEEHYRRIAYANDHFASGKPGWMTDRGRIYIVFGPPDRKETNPTGTHLTRPNYRTSSQSDSSSSSGGMTTMTTYPFEVWEYRYLEGVGTDISIEFVDASGTNEYRIALHDYEKDALFSITGSHVITGNEQNNYLSAKDQPFEKLETYTRLMRPPEIKFKKLEEAVSAKVIYKDLPVESQDNYIKLTDESVLAAVTVEMENRNLSFEGIGDTYQATVNLYGRVTDITKRVVEAFEDVVTAHQSGNDMKQGSKGRSIYQKKMALRPGRYVIDAVVEDPLSGRMGSVQKLLVVPRMGESSGLTSSSLILAQALVPVETAEDLKSQFVVGDMKVIPNVLRRFKKGERVGIYFQVYNLALDQALQKPAVDLTVSIKKGSQVLRQVVSPEIAVTVSGQQVTIKGATETAGLEPGEYGLEISLTDKIASKNLVRAVGFTIQ